jgi:hypothetical protein
MLVKLVLAAAAALVLSGCSMLGCGASADNQREAGSCSAGTTFLTSGAASARPAAFTKS